MDLMKLYNAFRASTGVNTDSRTIAPGEMFLALKGENFDGNEYALGALEKGASCVVVTEGTPAAEAKDPRIIAVPDTLVALQALARHHRENTIVDGKRLTVIGLTGTNGKTTTKELITKVLSRKYNVTATRGNLNNDIGVPLSLLKIDGNTQIAVIEMGANHPDDIEKLVKVSEPDFGLITNVGKAHLLGFGSFEGVKAAKGKLYDYIKEHGGSIFINEDDENLKEMAAQRGGLKSIGYGICHWGASVVPADAEHPFVRILLPSGIEGSSCSTSMLESHLAGAYNANNIAAAIAIGLHFGVSLDDAVAAISEYIPVNNRSQMVRSERNILIEDAYNANPTSMAAALDNLESINVDSKVALLGDMRELGSESVAEHAAVLRKLVSMKLGLTCLVGEEFSKAIEAEGIDINDSSLNIKWFETSSDLASWLGENNVSGATVLVKGSRGIKMETVIPEL